MLHSGTANTLSIDGIGAQSGFSSRSGFYATFKAETGMIGYPQITMIGVNVQIVYNPMVLIMSKVKLETVVESLNGTWYPSRIDHHLSCNYPNGPRYSTLSLINSPDAKIVTKS